MMNVLIWFKNVLILVFSVFFLAFGITNLWGAFRLNNPQEFLMLFFSNSLIILISAVGIIYFVFRFFPLKISETDNTDTNDDEKK